MIPGLRIDDLPSGKALQELQHFFRDHQPLPLEMTETHFNSTTEEKGRKVEGFSEKSKFPNVVAAIDGSHIPIKAPKDNHEDYFNRKHFYSFLVQGIVDFFICCHWISRESA